MNILELWSLFYSYPRSTYGWRRVVRFGRRFSVAKPGFQPSVKNGKNGLCMTVRLNPSLDWCVWRCLKMSEDVWRCLKMSEDVWSPGSCCGCKIIYIYLYIYIYIYIIDICLILFVGRLTETCFWELLCANRFLPAKGTCPVSSTLSHRPTYQLRRATSWPWTECHVLLKYSTHTHGYIYIYRCIYIYNVCILHTYIYIIYVIHTHIYIYTRNFI